MLLPQLDFSFYPSQIFWFIISFGIVFVGVKTLILPLYREIISKRYNSLGNEIQTAVELQQKILKMKNQRLSRLDTIQKELNEKFSQTLTELNKKQTYELEKARADHERAIKEYEKSIITQKQLILENIEPYVKMHVDDILKQFKQKNLIQKND